MSPKTLLFAGIALSAAVLGTANAAAPRRAPPPSLRPAYDETGLKSATGNEYEPVGAHAGAFFVYPSVTGEAAYDDNIYARPTNTAGDWIFSINPVLRVLSNWGRNALDFTAEALSTFHRQYASENTTDWSGRIDGRVDVLRGTIVTGQAGYAERTEARGAATDIGNTAEPTRYRVLDAALAVERHLSILWASLSGAFGDYRYEPVALIGGGAYSNSDRDYRQWSGEMRAGYDMSPDTSVYLRGAYNDVQYRLQPPSVPDNRDSSGYEFGLGADLRITQPLHGSVFAGYRQQFYNAPLTDLSGFVYSADLFWDMTRRTQFHLFGASSIEQPVFTGSSGILSQSLGLGVTHMFLPNVRGSMQGRYVRDQFRGANRTDNGWDVDLRLDYLLNRNYSLGLGYRFQQRNSTDALFDFQRNILFADIRAEI